jgi:hypothetical protein
MSSDLLDVFLLSLVAMFNPTLLAAVTVMLLLPHPKRLMLGYLLGAYTTSIVAGVLILYSLHGSAAERTAERTIGPLEDLVVGLLVLAFAWVLLTGRDRPFQERRRRKKEAKAKAKQDAGKPTESLAMRLLAKGDPRVTFVVGAMLSFPGVAYLAALDHIHKLNAPAVVAVLLTLCFCLMQQIFLEAPLLGYVFAPRRTREAVAGFKAWLGRSGRTAGVIGACAIGALLIARGLITLS